MDFKEQYFDIWSKVWNFHKEFFDMIGTDEDWERLVKASGNLGKRYENTPQHEFATQLILAVLDELERSQKNK